MNNNALKRLENIEILFSEQEYTIQTLNEIVTRHAYKIDQLEEQVHLYKEQIIALQDAQNNEPSGALIDERPPHY
jgi:uncharacterized coiled-coil protein SlyX